MSDHHRAGSLDRSTAERLLDGADGHARLHAVLSAAGAPARPEELAGEDAAVAAFKAAPRPARTSRMAALRRFLTVKALVLVGGSLILSGGAAAYAAMNGHLPGSDPAPSPSPTLDEQTSTGQHSNPVAPVTPSAASSSTASPSAPSSTTRPPSKSASPTASKNPGGETAPGQERKPQVPGDPPQPPRGPGNGNGPPPGENNGNGNGNGNGRPPPGQNNGIGNAAGKPD